MLSRERGVLPRDHERQGVSVADSYVGYNRFRGGDIVMNKMQAWNGVFGLAASSGIISPDYAIFRPNPRVVDARFLVHLLRDPIYAGVFSGISRGMGTGFNRVHPEQFLKVPVPLPDLEMQRRIADFLDSELANLAHINDRSDRLTGLLEERKSALIAECFTFDEENEVSIVPLRRAVKRWIDYRGATPEKTDSGIPLVTAKNIREGRIALEASREYIAADAYKDWMRRGLLEVNDVLLTTEAPLGQVAMISNTYIALAQRVIVLRSNQELCSPTWLYWYLRSPQGQAELELRATGSTALGIKADRLRGVPIPLPRLHEASRRLSRLGVHVTNIEGLQKQLVRQRVLIAERRQALITAAVTGQFDVSTASGRNATEGVTV